jgi:hypothetical protein
MIVRALLIVWVALLGTDRIDLLGGRGPALLLPFHVLTALLIPAEWYRRYATRTLPPLTRARGTFAALVLTLLTVVGLSILRSEDVTMSLGRALLFAGTATGVPLVVWGAADRPELRTLLGRGAVLGLAIALVFNIAALGVLVGQLPREFAIGPVVTQLATPIYGAIPRLSGGALDMNRGGLVALFHVLLLLLAPGAPRGRALWVGLGGVLVLGSLSRSVLLCALPTLALTPRIRALVRAAHLPRAALLATVAFASALLLAPTAREGTLLATAPLAERFRLREGSAQEHAYLLARARAVVTQDVPTTIGGIGYGTSFRALSDIFAGNRYGNFHSTWFTLWAESGIFALLLILAIFLVPLRRAGPLTGFVLGLMLFNTFYNGFTEPLLWVTLAMAWSMPEGLT